jgi:hypothetical protein
MEISERRTRMTGKSHRRAHAWAVAPCLALALVGAALVQVPVASAAPCPNEAIREEQQTTYLPDCMALEMVSPVKKGGQPASNPSFSENGERILYTSIATLGDSQSLVSPIGDWYVASRGAGGWSTASTTAPAQFGFGFGFGDSPAMFSPDLGHWLSFESTQTQRLTGKMTVFEGAIGGFWRPHSPLLEPLDDPAGLENAKFVVARATMKGASADLSHVVIQPGRVQTQFLPGDPQPSGNDLNDADQYFSRNNYLLSEGPAGEPTVELLGRDSAGTAWGGNCGTWLGGGGMRAVDVPAGGVRNQGAIAADGSRIYFSTRLEQGPPNPADPSEPECDSTKPIRILVREETAGGPQIEELLPAPPGTPGDDFFEGASADQSKVYLTSSRSLAASDQDPDLEECNTEFEPPQVENTGCDLYLDEETPGGGHEVVQVSAGERALAVTATAETSAGSNELTGVVTATGSGSLVAGSKQVSEVTTSFGAFVVGQTVTGTGIPAATTITAVGGNSLTLSSSAAATGVEGLSAGAAPIAAGQEIVGDGIPPGATVTAVQGQAVTISATATETSAAASISAYHLPGVGADVVKGVTAISGDGTHVYFVAHGVLTSGPNPEGDVAAAGQLNLYAYERDGDHPSGRIAFVGELDPTCTVATSLAEGVSGQDCHILSGVAGQQSSYASTAVAVPMLGRGPAGEQVGGNGHVLVFESAAELTANDTDGRHKDLYRYDLDANPPTLECVSCRPGGPDGEPFDIATPPSLSTHVTPGTDFAEISRAVSEDGGMIVFRTAEPLVSGDTDGVENPYLWTHGTLTRLPAARRVGANGSVTATRQTAASVSLDGSQVAFQTTAALLPQDSDSVEDVYVARVDGGSPAPPPATSSGCGGTEECQGPPAPAPPVAGLGSVGYAGNGNVHSKPRKAKKHKKVHKGHRHQKRSGKNRGGSK